MSNFFYFPFSRIPSHGNVTSNSQARKFIIVDSRMLNTVLFIHMYEGLILAGKMLFLEFARTFCLDHIKLLISALFGRIKPVQSQIASSTYSVNSNAVRTNIGKIGF